MNLSRTGLDLALLGLVALAGCGPSIAGVPPSKSSGGLIAMTMTDTGPTFEWKACTAFNPKNCKPDELKVGGISVRPTDCSVGGSTDPGARPIMWGFIMPLGHPIAPPIHYGDVPEGAMMQTEPGGPFALTSGCTYQVVFSVFDGSQTGVSMIEQFKF